jgi:hypothetical protein
MITRIRIFLLKNKAHRLLYDYYDALYRHDCGLDMARQMPNVAGAARVFNATLDKLSTLDPNTPTSRL